MGYYFILLWLSFAALISSVAGTASPIAQTGLDQEVREDREIYRPDTMVMVRVEVRDGKGEAVSDLRRGDFTTYENGARRPLYILERGPSEATDLGPDQYQVGYIFKGELDGSYRKVRVVVRKKGRPGLKVKTFHDGFFARESRRR